MEEGQDYQVVERKIMPRYLAENQVKKKSRWNPRKVILAAAVGLIGGMALMGWEMDSPDYYLSVPLGDQTLECGYEHRPIFSNKGDLSRVIVNNHVINFDRGEPRESDLILYEDEFNICLVTYTRNLVGSTLK